MYWRYDWSDTSFRGFPETLNRLYFWENLNKYAYEVVVHKDLNGLVGTLQTLAKCGTWRRCMNYLPHFSASLIELSLFLQLSKAWKRVTSTTSNTDIIRPVSQKALEVTCQVLLEYSNNFDFVTECNCPECQVTCANLKILSRFTIFCCVIVPLQ